MYFLVENLWNRTGKSNDTTIVLKIVFEFRHGAIAVTLANQEPKHQETVAYCHVESQSSISWIVTRSIPPEERHGA